MAEVILEDLVWRNALAVIPLALIVALLCSVLPCRPSTRHALWVLVLLSLIVPPMLPRPSAPNQVPTFALPVLAGVAYVQAKAEVREEMARRDAAERLEADAPQRLRDHVPEDLAAWLTAPPQEHVNVVQRPSTSRSSPPQRDRRRGDRSSSRVATSRQSDQSGADLAAYHHNGRPPAASVTEAGHPAHWMTRGLFDPAYAGPREDSTNVAASDAPRNAASQLENDRRRAQSPLESTPYSSPRDHSASVTWQEPSRERGAAPAAAHESPSETVSSAGAVRVGTTPAADGAEAQRGGIVPAWMIAIGNQIGGWMGQLGRVRDAVSAIPPPPLAAWLIGLVLLLVALLGRAGRYRRIVRTAEPAPFDVQMLVQRIAKEMELRRVPDVRMIDARVAPMVWCGPPTLRLVLPKRLWKELDLIGRRTVICHELAHIKRRDHWICRVDLIVGLLYWWHPVVWWIRRRIREEAEYCCDTWVTSLLPEGRRAYAQALLQTRTYTAPPHVNALALGVGSGGAPRARRFARRLAMVMTHRHRPGMTLQGVLLVCGLGVLGYVAAPMVACPPDEKKQDQTPETTEFVVPATGADKAELSPDADEDGLTTFEQFMLQQNGEQPEPDQDTQRDIQEIEERIERLQERISELLESIEAPDPPSGLRIEIPHAPALETEALSQDALRRALEGLEVEIIEFDDCTRSRARHLRGRRDNCTPSRSRRVTRERDDCTPSRARRVTRERDDCTPSRGNVLSFSVSVADSDEDISRNYYLSRGKLRDLTELMARSDVPVWISRHSDHIEVHGTPAQHRVFEQFVRLIETGEAGGVTVYSMPASGSMDEAVNLSYLNAIEAQQNRGCSIGNVEAVDAQVESLLSRSRMFQEQSAEIERHAERLREQAERVREQAERLEEQFEDRQEEIEEVEQRARRLEDLARFNLMNEAHVLLASAQTVRSESSRLTSYARLLESQADAFEVQAENCSDQSGRYEDLAEELRELAETYRERQDDDADYAGE